MTISITIAATHIFSDVPENEWFTGAVNSLHKKGIISGYQDGTFQPNQNVTRAEVAVMLDRSLFYIETKNWKKATLNGFSLKYPENWITSDQSSFTYLDYEITSMHFKNEDGDIMASWNCPIYDPRGFELWNFTNESRKHERDGREYSVHLAIGTPNEWNSENTPFIRINIESDNFYEGCEITSESDEKELFRHIYQSIT